jgi:hypothetical protein
MIGHKRHCRETECAFCFATHCKEVFEELIPLGVYLCSCHELVIEKINQVTGGILVEVGNLTDRLAIVIYLRGLDYRPKLVQQSYKGIGFGSNSRVQWASIH